MTILDVIAQGGGQGILEGFQVGQQIRGRQQENRIREIQMGEALRKMQMEKQAQEQAATGFNAIRDYYANRQTAPTSALAPPVGAEVITPPPEVGPGQPTPIAPTEAQAMATKAPMQAGGGYSEMLSAVSQIPTDDIKDLDSLVGKLGSNPQMASQFAVFNTMLKAGKEEAVKLTEKEQEATAKLMSVAGGLFEGVSRLEEAGDIPGAERYWNTVSNYLANDKEINKHPDVVEFLDEHKEYQPGLGKIMYLRTATGEKARDQLQKEKSGASDTYKEVGSDGKISLFKKGTGEFVDYLRDETGKPFIDFSKAKEAAVQGRFEAGQAKQQKVAEITAKKFDIKHTDDILRYKRQEDKDLKEMKESLERAVKMAESGGSKALIDKFLQQGLSKVENTSVRALAELDKFKNFGDIQQRISGRISAFFEGDMTDEQRQIATETARNVLNNYVNPAYAESNSYWRRIASERDLDPDQIANYKTKEEVGADFKAGNISRKQAEAILNKPRFKWPTP